jgi:DNA-binding SARP family transcriptional activator
MTNTRVLPAQDRVVLPGAARPIRHPAPVVGVPGVAGLARPRLMAALDRVLESRICAVVAPAGAGKTTAIAHWARGAAVDVAWFRAVPGDADPRDALVAGLAAAVRATDRRGPGGAGWDDLLDACTAREAPLVLVVDDLHHLTGNEFGTSTGLGSAVERLLLETDRVHLVVATRTPPPLNLARTELASAVLGPADLRFRPAETAALYRDGYALPLSDLDARVLTRRTGGWAAALHLFRHTVTGRPPEVRHRAVHALGRRDDYAREYLAQTVLDDLAAPDVAFLRSTATLEVLTGDLCDRLLGVTGSQDRLADLRLRGVLVPAESGPGLCVPEVLRSHLLAAARAEAGDAATDQRFRDTAALLVRDGHDGLDAALDAAAVRASVAGRDWGAASALAATGWAAVVGDPDLDWVDAVPGSHAGREVQVARAVRARRDGALDVAAGWADPIDVTDPHDAVERTAQEVARFCRTWTTGDLHPGGAWTDHLRAAIRRPQPGRRTTLAAAHDDVLTAFELGVAGAWAEAARVLRGLAGRLDDDVATACAVELLDIALNPADPDRADALGARAEDLGLTWLARIAHGLACAHRGDDAALTDAAAAADDRGDRWGALLLGGLDAAARLRARLPATRSFDDVVRRCRDLDAPALEAWARSGAALAAAATHLPDAGRDAESAIGFAHSAQVPGALALAYAAAGLDRNDPELLRLADDEADRIGLDVRPWTWPVDDGDRAVPGGTAAGAPSSTAVRSVPPLAVRCFGGFELQVDGSTPDLARVRPRARALLRLLALYAGQPVHREVIVDAMWPQLDAAAATHNLHVCVSGLRSALEPGVARGASRLVVRDGERYLLALPDGALSDLRSFDALIATAERARNAGASDDAIRDLDAALHLYTGDVLPEDGPTEWVLPHREQYKVRAAEAAALLGRLHLDHGRPEQAAAAARRSIDVDPCRDASWRLLVAAHEAAGDLAASEEARRSYAEVLESLGVVSSAASSLGMR